jgi:hypothetical protein
MPGEKPASTGNRLPRLPRLPRPKMLILPRALSIPAFVAAAAATFVFSAVAEKASEARLREESKGGTGGRPRNRRTAAK